MKPKCEGVRYHDWVGNRCSTCGKWKLGTKERYLADFWAKVEKTDTCWNWIGSMMPNGYGHAGWPGGKTRNAHKISWMLAFGDVPEGLCVCHKCDNRRCVRPDHLFLGTFQENQNDSMRKGRKPCKLHPRCIPVIQSRARAGESQRDLAADYGVSKHTIYRAINGRRKDAAILSRETL